MLCPCDSSERFSCGLHLERSYTWAPTVRLDRTVNCHVSTVATKPVVGLEAQQSFAGHPAATGVSLERRLSDKVQESKSKNTLGVEEVSEQLVISHRHHHHDQHASSSRCMYVHMYVHMYICVYAHTHTHIYMCVCTILTYRCITVCAGTHRCNMQVAF